MFSAYLRDITDRREVERMKDEMVSTVSHELRTPLSSLRGFVELLLTRDYPREEQRRFLSIVDQEIGRLTKLINEFLDVQRLEAGGPQFHFEKCELQSLLRDSLEVIRARGGPHVFTLSVPEPTITVNADADAIRQVMMNLLSNAVKFSPNGGSIAVRAEVSGGHALVGVRDAGIGMSSDTVGKLFAKFFRADNSATRSIEGTGLGLALVKQIVTQHGGEVGVTSELGHGSEFTFTLELAKPEDEPA
jgi:signal transduction histidine kinase